MKRTRCLAGSIAAGILLACSELGPEEALLGRTERGPAILEFYGDTTSIELPENSRVGEEVSVRFVSFGGGCIGPDTTEAEVSGLRATVRPFHREITKLPPRTACTAELRLDRRAVSLRFEQPGRALVRIIGLKRPGNHSVLFERELQIAP